MSGHEKKWIVVIAVAAAGIGAGLWNIRTTGTSWASFLQGDPNRGGRVFFDKGCIHCHSISGIGGTTAAKLGRTPETHLTLGQLVGVMWNHAPHMWKTMEDADISFPEISQRDMVDLFAYLYIARYLDERGDIERGERLLVEKGCDQCHSLYEKKGAIGPDLRQWGQLDHPVLFISGLVVLCFMAVVIVAASAVILHTSTVQPIEFDHQNHFAYFRTGAHRQAKLEMHEEILGEIPEELVQGDCIECHGDFADAVEDTPKIRACAGCHETFLKYDIRARRDVRPCIGCHRNAVSGYAASLPGVGVCAACHEEPLTQGREEQKLGAYIEGRQEIPWSRVYDYLPGDVVFSHERHVMLGEMNCRQCHGEVEDFTTPLVRLVDLEMGDCIDCHESAGANIDCMVCHR